jgi:hypothetical protein
MHYSVAICNDDNAIIFGSHHHFSVNELEKKTSWGVASIHHLANYRITNAETANLRCPTDIPYILHG